MRLQFSNNIEQDKSLVDFAKWILAIGDGTVGESVDGESLIEIP
jgi:hypothetical protein